MELIYGTTNPAKVMSMKKMLSGLDLQLRDLCSCKHLPVVEEIGSSPSTMLKQRRKLTIASSGDEYLLVIPGFSLKDLILNFSRE